MKTPITFAEICFRHKGEKVLIKSTEIVLLSADINYTTFHLKDGRKYTSPQTMLKYDSYLNPHNFIRINKNQMVNISEVKEITKDHRSCNIELHNGMNLKASRRKRKMVLESISIARTN